METVLCFLVTAEEETALEGIRAIPQVLDVLPLGEMPGGSDTRSPEGRLYRQRQIIHARRGDLKRFLNQKRLRCIPGGNGDVPRLDAARVPVRRRFRRLPALD